MATKHKEKANLQDDQSIGLGVDAPNHPQQVTQTEAHKSHHAPFWPLRSDQPCGQHCH